jgi:hypothetical protein
MKINDIVESIAVYLTNEEQAFVNHFGDTVGKNSLDEHAGWVAQNLVRKGVYEISKDAAQINKVKNVFYLRSSS